MGEESPPSLSLRVGLTGHRAVSGQGLASVVAAADLAFAAMRSEMASLSEVATGAKILPELKCFTGLAAGADLGLARAALARGFRLVGVLAFAREEFERDFTDEAELREFRRLLSQASSVVELKGARSHEVDAYVAVGDYLIAQSDIVVAVWDGRQARGPGGTGDVVAGALRAGKSVFAISPADPQNPRWLGAEPLTFKTAVQHAVQCK
jgi:hypothetical protein